MILTRTLYAAPLGHAVALAVALLTSLAATNCRAAEPAAHAAAPTTPPPGMAGRLIEHFHMQKVPQEGCWFSLSYASGDTLDGDTLPARYGGRPHPAGNAIVAVETPRDFSALHRLQTDEVWHFYEGSPLDMLLLYPDGHAEHVTLGANVLAGERRQFTVPRGVWQGSAPRDKSAAAYSFFADQLAPGFDYADFEIGYRDELQRRYPAYAREIARLTRAEFALRPVQNASPAHEAKSTPDAGSPQRREPKSFAQTDVAAQSVAPGVSLQELVGLQSQQAFTPRLSVAQFTLAPGHSTGTSYNQRSEEVFLVLKGSGHVHVLTDIEPVGPGSTVFIPATLPHSIESEANTELQFLAIEAPAFTPEDYVPVRP